MTPMAAHLTARGWQSVSSGWTDPETGIVYTENAAHLVALNRAASRFHDFVSEVIATGVSTSAATIALDMAQDVAWTVERTEYFATYYGMSNKRPPSLVDAALNLVIFAEREAARGVRRIRQEPHVSLR